MAIQATIKINPSLQKKLEGLEKIAEDGIKDKLESIAADVIKFSPVDTGTYVTSHSFKTNTSSRGRGRPSTGKPRGQNPSSMRQLGYSQLISDIENLKLEDLQKITLRNDSPHAQIVESGIKGTLRDSSVEEFDPRQSGYFVYKKVRSIYK
jgi:hypothetical protein